MREAISEDKKRIDIEIGKRIRSRREEIGMSTEELTGMLGFANYSTLWKLESGTSSLRCHSLKDITRALGTSISYILGDTNENPGSKHVSLEKELYSIGQLLPDDDLQIVVDLAWTLYRKLVKGNMNNIESEQSRNA